MNDLPNIEDAEQADNRRSRKTFLIIFGIMGMIALVVGGSVYYFDGSRVLAKDGPALEALRVRYCDIEAARSKPGAVETRPIEPVKALGRFYLSAPTIDEVTPGGNADTIDAKELDALCQQKQEKGRVLTSLLTELLWPDTELSFGGVKKALSAVHGAKYLVVLSIDRFTPSVAVTDNTMVPGHFTGTASIYRLSDAQLMGAAHVDRDAPDEATVVQANTEFTNLMLAANTEFAFQDAICAAFHEKNIDLTLR